MTDEHLNKNLQHLGGKLRYFRQQREFTLRALAKRADVSASLLSQIENGKANPSVVTLHNIAAALSVPLAYFFASDKDALLFHPVQDEESMSSLPPGEVRAEGGISLPYTSQSSTKGVIAMELARASLSEVMSLVLRRDDRASINLQGGIIWERLTSMTIKGIEFLHIEYEVGVSSGAVMSRHPGTEFGYVLEGTLTLNLGFDEYLLHPGDSIVFSSGTPHRLTNSGVCPVCAFWVIFDYMT